MHRGRSSGRRKRAGRCGRGGRSFGAWRCLRQQSHTTLSSPCRGGVALVAAATMQLCVGASSYDAARACCSLLAVHVATTGAQSSQGIREGQAWGVTLEVEGGSQLFMQAGPQATGMRALQGLSCSAPSGGRTHVAPGAQHPRGTRHSCSQSPAFSAFCCMDWADPGAGGGTLGAGAGGGASSIVAGGS